MNHIKRNMFLVLFIACSSLCFAKQVSFQVVQHNNSYDTVTEESYFVEDKLINSFFDAGYIVTNSETSTSSDDEETSALWTRGAKEASDGGSDYFVQVVLSFTEQFDDTINKMVMILDKIDYSIHYVSNLAEKGRGSLNCNLKVKTAKDLTVVSGKLVDEIFKVINA